jgi:hypothetical protein
MSWIRDSPAGQLLGHSAATPHPRAEPRAHRPRAGGDPATFALHVKAKVAGSPPARRLRGNDGVGISRADREAWSTQALVRTRPRKSMAGSAAPAEPGWLTLPRACSAGRRCHNGTDCASIATRFCSAHGERLSFGRFAALRHSGPRGARIGGRSPRDLGATGFFAVSFMLKAPTVQATSRSFPVATAPGSTYPSPATSARFLRWPGGPDP